MGYIALGVVVIVAIMIRWEQTISIAEERKRPFSLVTFAFRSLLHEVGLLKKV